MHIGQFLISALRAMLEVFMLSLIGQAALFLLLAKARQNNVIYRLFSLLTAGPRRLLSRFLPSATPAPLIALAALLIALSSWLALAWMRKLIDYNL